MATYSFSNFLIVSEKFKKKIFYAKIVFQVKIYVEVAKVWGKSLGRRFYMKASAAEAKG